MNRCSRSLLLLALLPLAQGAVAGPPAHRVVVLATTTSTQDSGLLDVLVPLLEEQRGIVAKVLAVGSGEALAMGRRGDADVLLVHSPQDEEAFMAEGCGLLRLAVMHNDFLVVGPAADPAGARGLGVVEALGRIAAAGAPWASRGDRSGTHRREQELWRKSGLPEPSWAGALSTGQGMGETARIASEKGAYTLVDRGTFLALRATLDLIVVAEGGAELLNPYHVIVVNPERAPGVHAAEAREVAEWLVSAPVQRVIGDFGRAELGQPLFVPDAG